MEIITCGSQAEWDKIVKSFATWDVYYLSQYVKSLQLHGDGEPLLIYYQSEQMRIAYVVQQTDIAGRSLRESRMKPNCRNLKRN